MVTTDKWAWRLRYLGMLARGSTHPRKLEERKKGQHNRVREERGRKRRARRRQ